ncbi:MAG: DUF3333 domain-containing protein, partial [Deferribacteres bacterium]|nr:DUF3333 domain-containing protein [Deferribacteres bacterium]
MIRNSHEARLELIKAGLKRRYAKEKIFRALGVSAITAALIMLAVLFVSITKNGYSAFQQTFIRLEVSFDASVIDPDNTGDPGV